MFAVLALASALVYGASDFLGGIATRRAQALGVVLVAQLTGTAVLVAAVFAVPGTPSPSALAWGLGAGLAGSTGLVVFYRALASGMMSVVAPVAATIGAGVPVLAGIALGERPDTLAQLGIITAVAAVALISWAGGRGASARADADGDAPRTRRRRRPVLGAAVAGVCFGLFFVMLSQPGETAGLWPLIGSRVSSLALVLAGALALGRLGLPRGGARIPAIGAGLLDAAATVLYLLAVHQGLLSLVAVLTGLYPASTVLLARVALGERLRRVQVAGVTLALAAVALIAV